MMRPIQVAAWPALLIIALLLIPTSGCDMPVGGTLPRGPAWTPGTEVWEFGATWCGPCKDLAPILDKYEAASNVTVRRIDVDAEPDLAAEFNISSIPAIVVLKNGEEVDRLVGLYSLESLAERLPWRAVE